MLKQYIKTHSPVFLLAISFIVIGNIILANFPRVIEMFTNDLQSGVITATSIRQYSVILLGIGISYAVLFGAGQFTTAWLGRSFEFLARQKCFEQFTRLGEHYFSRHGIGQMLSHVMNDVKAVREALSRGINQTTNASVLIISVIVMMSLSAIPLYLIISSILPLLPIPFIVIYFGPKIRMRSRKVQESLAWMTESAEEQFGGIRVTKTFAVEEMAAKRFGSTVDEIRDTQLRLVKLSSLFQALIPFMGALALITALVFGGYLTMQDQISLGNFASLMLYLAMITGPLQQIGNVIDTMQRSRASVERINALLAVVPEIRESPDALPLPIRATSVRVGQLTFSYPDADHPALHDIEFQVEAGKTLGIVGKTGSGKTTLAKLLLRIYDPPVGKVRIGRMDIHSTTLESLRTQIAYVPQDGFLFSTTIRDNIAFYNREVAFEHVEAAAKHAQLYETILTFPKQFDTRLGERGVTLSGGQRQRTSLARGLIKDAPILILDDSFSAVDAVTETNLIEHLRAVRQGKTTLIIAHRMSAVKHADEIIVMDEGRIVERGTHEALLKSGGLYAGVFALQEEGTHHARKKEPN